MPSGPRTRKSSLIGFPPHTMEKDLTNRDQHKGLCRHLQGPRVLRGGAWSSYPRAALRLVEGAAGLTKFSAQRIPYVFKCPSTQESRLELLQHPAEKQPPSICSHTSRASKCVTSSQCLFYPALIFFFFFFLFWLYPQHPRPGIKFELQLPAYDTPVATADP